MTTLVINAPRRATTSESKRSFDSTFASGVGEGYAIAKASVTRCLPGSKVVLLSTDEGKRAEGTLVKLEPAGKARNGLQRYDVHVANLARVAYRPEQINRYGVAVISEADE